jgi:hypothetical protein
MRRNPSRSRRRQRRRRRVQRADTGPLSPFPCSTPAATALRRGRRDERRKANLRPDKELPRFFTDLFDKSYIAPPGGIDLQVIYLSRGLASDDVLRVNLPGDIVLFTCEWDELRAEAGRFKERSGSEGLGKWRNIKGV